MTLMLGVGGSGEDMSGTDARRSDTARAGHWSDGRIPVVHLISNAGPHPYFRTFMSRADHDRFRYLVGCVGPAGALQEEMTDIGVATFSLDARSKPSYAPAALALARRVRRLDVRVIQTHLPLGSGVGLPAARLARTPLAIHTAHHSHELPYHGWRLRAFERLMAGRLADVVSAPSKQVAEVLVDTGIPAGKIEVIHHGFDLDRFRPDRVRGEQFRARLGIPEAATAIGTVGREFFLKNTGALVEAFDQIARQDMDLHLVIAHRGDSPNTRERIAALPSAERIHLIRDIPDVEALLDGTDLYAHPAIAESFGMAIVEAMGCALPVISTPVGIAPEAIRDGVNGWLSEVGSAAGLLSALNRALESRARWSEIGRAARETAATFPIEQMVRAHEQLYAVANLQRAGAPSSQVHDE
jgi:glycosyltransferase involved in cell wall biosynthesis